jgi:hypothetical protein
MVNFFRLKSRENDVDALLRRFANSFSRYEYDVLPNKQAIHKIDEPLNSAISIKPYILLSL